ncbi:Lipase (class 3) [Ceratobasidium sp. AG-Ba]|nr:Lipase (class 3) [Ceratobasidium sp. AG-Ba]QRW03306.1 Lipase (class 3) [Ceratobasidium sp. AG-Ba]
MGKYNCFQHVFRLSLCANLVRDVKDTAAALQEELTKKIPPVLADIDPGWSVASKPVVWKTDPDKTDTKFGNAWFVAKHDALEFENGKTYRTCVMAIAGTASLDAAVNQDGDIHNCVPIDSWAGSGPEGLRTPPVSQPNKTSTPDDPALITNGFGQPTYRHLNLTHDATTPNVVDFFTSELRSYPDTKFVVAGHSLGAALACCVAYSLVRSGVLPTSNVLVNPSAGPSPGNKPLLENFTKFFPPPEGSLEGYKHWNTNIINPFDIVPCGYCMDTSYTTLTLDKVAHMFGAPKFPFLYVNYIVGILRQRAKDVYYPIANSAIESPYPKPPTPPSNATIFFEVAMKQHGDAYVDRILGHVSKSVFDSKKDAETLVRGDPEHGGEAGGEDTD